MCGSFWNVLACGSIKDDHHGEVILLSQPDLLCWKDEHAYMAGVATVALMYSVLTTTAFSLGWLEKGRDASDIKWSPLFSLHVSVVLRALVLIHVVCRRERLLVLGCSVVGCLWLLYRTF